jgi:alkanesulfonate monooxygenase SsuD/methylene tetrahydromethanopterin reductase-like flavin-dependent oxidoreductase (luciferase family)
VGSTVKFSLEIPVSSPVTTVERIVEVTQTAEALGYDAVMISDHLGKSFERHRIEPAGFGSADDPSNTTDPIVLEMVPIFAYLAAHTKRIQMGTGVAPLPLRNPIMLGKQIATLDTLLGGRFIFGVGISNITDKPEFKALGVPFLPYAERYELAADYIRAMRAIWEQPIASYKGPYVSFEDLTIYPKPARRVPVLLGAGPLTGGPENPRVKFALAVADGYMPPYTSTVESLAASVRDFSAAAARAGKDLTSFQWWGRRRFSIARTKAKADANANWMATEQSEMWRYTGSAYAEGKEGVDLNAKLAIVGTPEEIKASIDEYVAAGARHIEIGFIYPRFDELMEQLELFAETVMPLYQ